MRKAKRFFIRVHPAGAVMFALALLFLPSYEVLAAVVALIWHEAAHVLAMRLCGIAQCVVELTPFGGMADADSFEKLPPARQALCAAAGVIASGAGALCLQDCNIEAPFLQAVWNAHLSLALINCLPVWPLDGARVWMALGVRLGCENSMRRFLAILTRILGVLLAGLGLYGAWMGHINPSLLVAGPYLCYAASFTTAADYLRRLRLSQQKLRRAQAWETRILSGCCEERNEMFVKLSKQFSAGRYTLFCQLDPDSGRMIRTWTEKEMLDAVLNEEGIADQHK